MNKQASAPTWGDIAMDKLCIVQGLGPIRKTGASTGTTKAGNEHVIYDNERVSLMTPKKGGKR